MSRKPIVLCFDTETTGKPPPSKNPRFQSESFFNDKVTPAEEWPRVIQLAFILYDTEQMKQIDFYDKLIKLKPGEKIPPDSTKVHGITDEHLEKEGISVRSAMKTFIEFYDKADFVVGHNVQFDINVVSAELTLLLRDPQTNGTDKKKIREILQKLLWDKEKKYCTLQNSRSVCKLPKYIYDTNGVVKDDTGHELIDYTLDYKGQRKIRNPRLETAHQVLFQQKPNGKLHDALVDVAVCLRIFLKLYIGIDVCDSEYKSKNEFICDTINPSDLKPSEIPRRIGEPVIHPDIIKEMNSIKLGKTSSLRRTKKTRSLSLKRESKSKSHKKTRSL
jgi:DNA polymerase III epsilon subunit-like protein